MKKPVCALCTTMLGTFRSSRQIVRTPRLSYRIFVWADSHHKLCASILLVAFIVVCAASIYNNSWTNDEPGHLAFGRALLDRELNHALEQTMPISALNAVPQKVLQRAGVVLRSQHMTWLSRLPTLLFAAVLGYYVFSWSRELYGIKGGLLSLFVFVFCPTTVAHARLATNDIYCALFFFLSVFSFVGYMRKRTWPNLLRTAGIIGMAQLTKHTALLLFPMLFLAFCVQEWVTWQDGYEPMSEQLQTMALHGLTCLLVVAAIINIGYGFRGSFQTLETHKKWLQSAYPSDFKTPPHDVDNITSSTLSRVRIPLPGPYIEAFILGQYYNRTGKGHGPIYLLGNRSQYGWWYYFAVAFLLKTPLPTIGLVMLALFASIKSRRLQWTSDETVLLFSAAVVFAFFSLFCTAQIGIRYVLPAMPFLYVLVGQLADGKSETRNGLWNGSVLALCVWLPMSFFSYYPHYISYFNELCPNRLELYKCLADSNLDWGQNRYYLERYLAAHRERPVQVNPNSRVAGTVIVSVNDLVGVRGDPSTYRWLRNEYSPTSHVGYSWLVYEVPETSKK